MREIKFRARSVNLPRCWIYGYFVVGDSINYIINNEGKFKVIAGTEGQYTGLRDKNGKKIYEADLFKTSSKHGYSSNCYAEVFFNDGCFAYHLHRPDSIQPQRPLFEFRESYLDSFEVIGNIYENQELLKD